MSGYLVRDGKLRRLVDARRTDERDEETGGVARIQLVATDSDGRVLCATADAVSRMALGGSGAA